MAAARYFLIGGVVLFGVIGAIGWLKREPKQQQEVPLVQEISLSETAPVKTPAIPLIAKPVTQAPADSPSEIGLPEVDRIQQLFAHDSSKLPIVETVSYTSRVPWLKGRPAWIADYASHFETSRCSSSM